MFFIIPVGVEYRARRYPVVTFTLIGINIIFYLISLFAEAGERGDPEALTWWEQTFWLIPQHSHWYAYFTSLFVHAGFFHLLGNMIYLFLFGSCVEDIIGRWRYITFYLLGGLASDLAYIGFNPEHLSSELALGGASGAVFGCMGGFVLLLPRRRVEFKYFYWLIWRASTSEFFLPAWLVMSFWFLKDLFFAVPTFLAQHTGGGVAFSAHVGGFASGLLMDLAYKLVSQRHELKQHKLEEQAHVANQRPVYLYDGGAQAGPFTVLHVRQMLDLGSVSQDALYWSEGMPGLAAGSGTRAEALMSNWRKGWFMRPFCHLLIRAVRVDSPPFAMNRALLSQLIVEHRIKAGLAHKTMAAQLRVSLKTLQNWESGRTISHNQMLPVCAGNAICVTVRNCAPTG